ncbi:hypothetical protein PGTUg99_009073 [Puccinia graminis f. sp. tritici]|uniref:Uncharacterized protein n=1 Tax=Puccinia graminis f. sp. tritici TaxID=56615 RepID=A0A5B0MPH0_PUCGR|nr:hypothetical protein PGTUg99_009073 [Puccinia graminis f. sp. tritici]
MASHQPSGTNSYEELCEMYPKELIDQATRPTIEDPGDVTSDPVNLDPDEESVLLQLTYSVWLSNPPAHEGTHGLRSDRRSYLWHEHHGPPNRPLYISIPPAAREWSWGAFQRGVIRSLVSHNLEVGHEIRCNHAAGELVWQMYRGSAAQRNLETAPSVICARSWPASVRRILRSPIAFGSTYWPLMAQGSKTQTLWATRLDLSPLPNTVVWPSDPHGVVYTQIYEGKDHPGAPMSLPLQGLTPAKLTRLVFFHLSRERRSIHVDRVAQDADASKSLQWHFTIIEPGQAPALGSFMRGEGCFEDFVHAARASSPQAKVVIRLYMQYDDRHIRPLPHKERRYQVIGPRSPRAETTSRPHGPP